MLFDAEESLKCHQCTSTKSWDDCTKEQKEVTCPVGEYRCTVATGRRSSAAVYAKGCATESQCLVDRSPLCKPGDTSEDCHVSCCDGNLCNEAKVLVPTTTPTPRPVKCYQCFSNKSWDDCDHTQQVVTCPTHAGSCAKVVLDGKRSDQSVKIYSKLCITFTTATCNPDDNCNQFLDQSQSVTATKCDISCCNGDLCNGAKVPMISAIILWACALVVLR